MTLHQRSELILSRRAQLLKPESKWRGLFRWNRLLLNLLRLGFFLLVLAVLAGVWVVADAHLTEQFLGTPQTTQGLIDQDTSQRSLTPDNIEKQILTLALRLRARELEVPAGNNPRPRPFTVNPGEPARFIAARLQSAGFITDADLFNLYLRVSGMERRIEAGNFMLADNMTMPQVAEALQHALFAEAVITIPEGFRLEEIADRLATENVMDREPFLAAVRQPRNLSIFADYEFLQILPPNATLEGFMFPDTYRLPVFASTPELVIKPFLDNFVRKLNFEGLAAGSSGLSGRDLITLASIVEREAVQADERPLIASVYVNRLRNACPDVGGNYLQADPTVQYARGVPGDWWWEPQNIEEYRTITSPYNTYLVPGLPPGPIASPGLSAIEATRNPDESQYCFFVATGDNGRHVFAFTLAEHEQNLRAYGYQ